MIDKDLEVRLHEMFVAARGSRYEYITVEQLLRALLEDRSAQAVLTACGANMGTLGKRLDTHIAEQTPVVPEGREFDTQPTLGFQRVVQRAVLRAQSAKKKEVNGADVLAAIFAERDSHAVYFLGQEGLDFAKVVEAPSTGAGLSSHKADQQSGASEIDAEETRQVLLLHDDRVPTDFALEVLTMFLLLDEEDAVEVLAEARQSGKALCGLFPREAAEFVVQQISAHARKCGHPLRCVTAVQR